MEIGYSKFMKKGVYELNLDKINELQEQCRLPAQQWLADCWSLNLMWRSAEAYRSQDRQNGLILHGRFKEEDFWIDVKNGKMSKSTAERGIALLNKFGGIVGEKVTWTLDSLHIKRLAMDIVLINSTYEEIEEVGIKYAIYRPPELVKLGDRGHFQFDLAKPYVAPKIDPRERLKGLIRRLSLETNPLVLEAINTQIMRLKKRLGI